MAHSILSTHENDPIVVDENGVPVRKPGRPKGTKNGEGKGVRANGGVGSNKDFADNTRAMLRLGRPQTIEDLQAIRDDGLRCTYCQLDMTYKPYVHATIDHVVPVIAGGSNNVSNIVNACIRSNKNKADMPAHQFITLTASTRADPPSFEDYVHQCIREQIVKPVNYKLGNLVHKAWRELSAGMKKREEYATITVWMVVNRACELAAIQNEIIGLAA